MSETSDRGDSSDRDFDARSDESRRAEPRARRSDSDRGASLEGVSRMGGGRSSRDRRDREGGGGRRGGGGRFRRPRRKVCAFCVDKVKHIDYKEHQRLRDFVSDRGKILKSRMTGTCLKHQRKLSAAIKRARQVALLPFVSE
jgi:small subunit ribosomal protein S18